jgi:hypothetical protein
VHSWRSSASTAVFRSSVPSDLKTHPRTPASKQSRTTCSESTLGKDQYSLGRVVFQDLPGRVHAIQSWHANVQNKKIGVQLPALLYRFFSLSGLSADLPAFVRSQEREQTETEWDDHRPPKCETQPWNLLPVRGTWVDAMQSEQNCSNAALPQFLTCSRWIFLSTDQATVRKLLNS